jgi:hypothetical protein
MSCFLAYIYKQGLISMNKYTNRVTEFNKKKKKKKTGKDSGNNEPSE